MNREVLINSLEEFMEETDARLTALEGDKPQGTLTSPDWCRIAGERLTEIEHLTAENKQLASERKTLSSVWHALKIDNERLAAEVERLAYDNANLEAAKPQAPENDTAVALASEMTTNAYLMNSIRGLQTQLAGASRQRNALIAERNTLAAQVDDLRNVNAGLRKHNASQQDLLVSGRLRSLRRIEALLAVEWVTGECPWCGNSHREGHEEDCQRQAALR